MNSNPYINFGSLRRGTGYSDPYFLSRSFQPTLGPGYVGHITEQDLHFKLDIKGQAIKALENPNYDNINQLNFYIDEISKMYSNDKTENIYNASLIIKLSIKIHELKNEQKEIYELLHSIYNDSLSGGKYKRKNKKRTTRKNKRRNKNKK